MYDLDSLVSGLWLIILIWSGYGTQPAGGSSKKRPFAMDADETQPMEPMEVEDASSLFSLEMPMDDSDANEDEIPPTQPDLDEPQPHKVRR